MQCWSQNLEKQSGAAEDRGMGESVENGIGQSDAVKERGSNVASKDFLWAEIEVAERYLVSAMFERAAIAASTMMQTLCSNVALRNGIVSGYTLGLVATMGDESDDPEERKADGEVGTSEHEHMVEAAGMVLLQAYYATGKVGEFFECLRSFNAGVATLPPTLVIAGVCLQISEGVFSSARTALEEFLPTTGKKGTMWGVCSCSNGQSSSRKLVAENYTDIAELYAVQVLAKGFRDPKSAMEWVKVANLTEERQAGIIRKIQVQMATSGNGPADHSDLQSYSAPTSVSLLEGFVSEKTQEAPEKKDQIYEGADEHGTNRPSIKARSLAIFKGFRLSEGFFSIRMLLELAMVRLNAAGSSRWPTLYRALPEGRALALGALSSLLLFILVRQRRYLRRVTRKSVSALGVGLRDLWQLAFNVQINPLAAMQPLSSSQF